MRTVLLLAALTSSFVAASAGARTPPPRAPNTLEARFSAALDSSRVDRALELARAILERRSSPKLATAALADSMMVRFFSIGSPEAIGAAEQMARHALRLRERTLGGRDLRVAKSLSTLATLLDYQGRWTEAVSLERRSLAIRLRARNPSDTLVARSHCDLGMYLFWLGRPAAAESSFVRSLEIYQRAGERFADEVADACINLAEALRVQERYAESEAWLRRGLAVADRSLARDDPLRTRLVNNLAGLYKDQNRYLEAEPLLVEALEMRRKLVPPDSESVAVGELNLAEVYRLQGRFDDAAPLYESALAITRRRLGPDNPNALPFLNQAAVFHRERGDLERANELQRESLAALERRLGPDHPLTAQALHDLATLLREQRRYAAAESLFRRALDVRTRSLGARHAETAITRLALARCLAEDPRAGDAAARPELAAAASVLNEARAFPEARLDLAELEAAMAERAGRPELALATLEQALAEVDTLRAHRGASDETRADFLASRLDLFDRVVALRLARRDVTGAFEAHERGRARVMLEQIAGAGVDFSRGVPAAESKPLAERKTRAGTALARVQSSLGEARAATEGGEADRLVRIAALEGSLDSAAAELHQALDAVKAASPLWRQSLTASGRPGALAEIQRALVGPRDLMLLYHVGARGSFVFVIPPAPARVTAHPLEVDAGAAAMLGVPPGPLRGGDLAAILEGGAVSNGKRIGLGAAEWLAGRRTDRYAIERAGVRPAADRMPARLHALFRVLVPTPVWSRVRRARTATIVVDGALHRLPFEALLTGAPGAGGGRAWLDEGPALRYASSATSMWRLAARDRPAAVAGAPVCVSVSDPVFDAARESAGSPAHGRVRAARTWERLPATARESQAVRRAFAPDRIEILERAGAAEPAVRVRIVGPPFLHLATHGFVDERRNDVLAGLVLATPEHGADDAAADGLLQAFEIYSLPLQHCELAVLSACETQGGVRVAGEGVFALSRAFLAAGARRVIASLWAVNDESTADLVGACFEGIARGRRSGSPADPALALRDAKRRVRSDPRWRDPFHWAALTLSGEP